MDKAKMDRGETFRGLIPTLSSQSAGPTTAPELRLSETEFKVMMGGLLYVHVLKSLMDVFKSELILIQ